MPFSNIPKTLDAGFFHLRLELQKAVLKGDAGGGAAHMWSRVSIVWAHIDTQSAGDTAIADHQDQRVNNHVFIRYQDGVKAGMRFIDDEGIILNIVSVHDPDRRRRILSCLCEEIGNDDSNSL